MDRAGTLITETLDVGLLADPPELSNLHDARQLLRTILDNPVSTAQAAAVGGEFERLRQRRAQINEELREIADQLRGLDDFAAADLSYVGELGEQNARLASIGLVPDDTADAACAMCGQPLGDHGSPPHEAISKSLARSGRRLELAQRDRPKIQAARDSFLERRQDLRDEARDVDKALEALAAQDELTNKAVEAVNVQSYVRGRIALYLDSTEDTGDDQLEALKKEVEALEVVVAELAEALDVDALRSRTTSLLRTVSRQMTAWAQELGLEHSDIGVQIDLDRLTIVADTLEGPAYMDRGEIGSGMNWVGYHLTAYLALQDFFIGQSRPVPSFLVLDQPSQAFFPRDRETGGDLAELNDTDREHTRQLYELTNKVVAGLDGKLQVIALDHADFEDDWFADAVVQRWRDGEALIPQGWYEASVE